MKRIPTCTTAATLLVLLHACEPAAPGRTWTGEISDSAGVTLVRNAGGGSWAPGEAWRAEVDLEIGDEEGPAEAIFGHVSSLAVGPDGRIYALDQQAQAVRVFRSDGTFDRSVGRPGQGPGEIGRFAFSVFVRGDTLLVADWSQARLSRYDLDGAFLASERIPVAGASRSWWASFDAGLFFRSLERFTDENGRWRGRDVLLRYAGEERADTVLSFEYEHSDIGSRDAVRVPLVIETPMWTFLEDGRLAWATLEGERIRIHGPDGTLAALVSHDAWTPRTPSDDEIGSLTSALGDKLEMLGGSRTTVERMPVIAPGLLPALTALHAGPEGTLWVQRMGDVRDVHPMALNTPDPPGGFGGPLWDVLDGEGRYLGTVELPARFRLMASTDSALYGVRRDSLEVERIVRLRLERR